MEKLIVLRSADWLKTFEVVAEKIDMPTVADMEFWLHKTIYDPSEDENFTGWAVSEGLSGVRVVTGTTRQDTIRQMLEFVHSCGASKIRQIRDVIMDAIERSQNS